MHEALGWQNVESEAQITVNTRGLRALSRKEAACESNAAGGRDPRTLGTPEQCGLGVPDTVHDPFAFNDFTCVLFDSHHRRER